MLCAASFLMAEETDSGLKVFVGLTHNPTVLDVPDTWARLVGEPGLLVMFESSLFQGLSGCTPLDRLLAVVTR